MLNNSVGVLDDLYTSNMHSYRLNVTHPTYTYTLLS